MIIDTLAATPGCRDGNCPTAWLTDRGTVVVQGYATEASWVEVPDQILRSAAAEILARHLVVPAGIPVQRGRESSRVIRRAASGNLAVYGREETPDVTALVVPAGEAAVEIEPTVLIAELNCGSVMSC